MSNYVKLHVMIYNTFVLSIILYLMKINKAKRSQRNKTKNYTRCKLNKEEVEKLLEKLKSKEISMKEVTSLTGVCEKQINNYLKDGVNLEKGHGSVKPNREITLKIMKLLSKNYKQSEISRECDINSSTLSNQCKVLTFIPRGCSVTSTGFGGYEIIFEIKHYKFGVIFYIRFRINTFVIIESIMPIYKEIIESLDLSIKYKKRDNDESDRIRDLIMEKASEDYFTYIPIKPTSNLNMIKKYKEFYQNILNDLKYEDIYSSLRNISCENENEVDIIPINEVDKMVLGGIGIASSVTFSSVYYTYRDCYYEIKHKKKNRKKNGEDSSESQIYSLKPLNYCVILIYLLIIILSLVYYIYYK